MHWPSLTRLAPAQYIANHCNDPRPPTRPAASRRGMVSGAPTGHSPTHTAQAEQPFRRSAHFKATTAVLQVGTRHVYATHSEQRSVASHKGYARSSYPICNVANPRAPSSCHTRFSFAFSDRRLRPPVTFQRSMPRLCEATHLLLAPSSVFSTLLATRALLRRPSNQPLLWAAASRSCATQASQRSHAVARTDTETA